MSGNISILNTLFRQWSGKEAITTEILPASGSDRVYYRISAQDITAIGAWNPDKRENKAFTAFSRHFAAKDLPVPEVYLNDESGMAYLQTDLGDQHLFGILSEEGLSERVKGLYRQVVRWLPRFQISGGDGLDYSLCYPRQSFDRQSMMWDLNYFKYYFVRLSGFNFDEQALEDDFDRLTSFLLQADSDYFLYRDFQSRNIMITGGNPFFIDFQGGRRGPLQYDIASLLFDAKANLPNDFRDELLNLYIQEASALTEINQELFLKYYYGFVLIRILQALGAYGFRGFYQKKEHFLQSIPFAVNNLKWLLQNAPLPEGLPMLRRCLEHITEQEHLSGERDAGDKLTLHIFSFSYKNGLPHDLSGNGGGFVFDCRALPNPGRYEEYKTLTGKDNEVIAFLEREPEVQQFVTNTCKLVEQSIQNYTARKFSSLLASYGCTGGQHRSVYCAEQLKQRIEGNYNINIRINHREQKF